MSDEPQAKHWAMLGYTTIKMPDGSRYDFRGTRRDAIEEHAKDCSYQIARYQRLLTALQLFLDGKTTQDPDAIR
jgi:hypothetical protein